MLMSSVFFQVLFLMAHMKFAQELQAKPLQVSVCVCVLLKLLAYNLSESKLFIVQRAAVQEHGH